VNKHVKAPTLDEISTIAADLNEIRTDSKLEGGLETKLMLVNTLSAKPRDDDLILDLFFVSRSTHPLSLWGRRVLHTP
jgi:hypothetical protein